jgi:hypothetical protein
MPALKTYSYKRAGELLREDQPYSIRTIERMVDVGDLERIGDRMRRAISERSIIAYQQGERGIWGADAKTKTADASREPATPLKRRTARGQGIFPSSEAATTSDVVSIPSRLPKRGLIRS